MNSIINKAFDTYYTESLFLRYKKIFEENCQVKKISLMFNTHISKA